MQSFLGRSSSAFPLAFARVSLAAAVLSMTGCSVDLHPEPLAAGASTSLDISIRNNASIARVTSSDPTVATALEAGGTSVNVQAGAPGTATLTAYDASNASIGTLDVKVAATARIALDPGMSNAMTILAGDQRSVHATTIGDDGGTLVGDGAIHFAAAGALDEGPTGWVICFGDCDTFAASAPGTGTLTMTATDSNASASIVMNVVATADSFTLGASSVSVAAGSTKDVSYSVAAAGAPVWTEAACTSADATVASISATTSSGLSNGPGTLTVQAGKAGTTTMTCTAGGKTQSLAVIVR